MRVDVMSVMRGVDSFNKLWARRATVTLPDGFSADLMSLPDLVKAKKTQREKDWPMLTRLVEAHYFQNCATANASQPRLLVPRIAHTGTPPGVGPAAPGNMSAPHAKTSFAGLRPSWRRLGLGTRPAGRGGP